LFLQIIYIGAIIVIRYLYHCAVYAFLLFFIR
jgi:hypothetical protein